MRIENERRRCSLSSIEEGEVFEYGNVLYLKTDELIDDVRTCVRLADGQIRTFAEDCPVDKCEARIVMG